LADVCMNDELPPSEDQPASHTLPYAIVGAGLLGWIVAGLLFLFD